MKEFFATFVAAKGTKIAAFVMACVVALGGGGASGYYLYGATRPSIDPAPIISEAEVEDNDVIPVELFEEEEEPEAITNKIYLVSTSVEKDLKVSIVNDVGVTIVGYPFEVYVSKYDEKSDASFLAEVTRQEALKNSDSDDAEPSVDISLTGDKYVDDDMDGNIAISDISGGQYKVTLAPMEGFDVAGALQIAEVKEKVEYKVVDVKNQIKKESQINAAIEDTSRKNVADEGGAPDVSALLNTAKEDEKNNEPAIKKVSKDEISSETKKAAAPSAVVSDGSPATLTKTTRTVGNKVAPAAPKEPEQQPEVQKPEEQQPVDQVPSASIKKLNLFRVGATRTETKIEDIDGEQYEVTYTYDEVTVSLPGSLTLYTNSPEQGSAESALNLSVSGEQIVNAAGIVWKSSDDKIASVSGNGVKSTVTSKKAGTATITAVVPYDAGNGETKTAEFNCKVTVNTVDLSVPLKDKDGNKLYLDEELKKEATLADLNTTDKFYKEEKKEETQQSVSVKSGSVGVDVSKWNGSINWSKVANSGVSFAIIRCGYRGSSTGALVQDPTFATNIKGAKAAGLKTGIYFFTQAVNEAEAVEEASMAVSLARSYGINMPIYIDTEAAGGRADRLSKAERTACIKAFCKTVASAGYTPGVYASKCWYYDNLNAGELSGYNIWVAQYAAACNYTGRYNMWQYTSKGSVPGISGSVDMDIYY